MPPADKSEEDQPAKSNMLLYAMAGVLVLLLGVGAFMFMDDGGDTPMAIEKPSAEFPVASKMYQLKDGSYLKLAFSIVVDADKVEVVRSIVEKEAPGRLPSGITMILGSKTREDLIAGTHKREGFARLLKKMLEERVFADYNKRQSSSRDVVEIREVLISDFVTQSG